MLYRRVMKEASKVVTHVTLVKYPDLLKMVAGFFFSHLLIWRLMKCHGWNCYFLIQGVLNIKSQLNFYS